MRLDMLAIYAVIGVITYRATTGALMIDPEMYHLWISAAVWLTILAALYLMPIIIAFIRNHQQRWAISALNILLGWTLVGWIAALVWALIDDRQRNRILYVCGECGNTTVIEIKPGTFECRVCGYKTGRA